jgi:serine/threonine-protein kinase PRP4
MATPTSVSEDGEIIETGVDDSNTVSSRNDAQRTSVDRRDRDYDRYSRSPDRAPSYRQNRRSPSPRGFKRARDDRDFYQGGRGGRSRPHYDDAYSNSRRHFHDEDRPHRGGSSRYDDPDRLASRHHSEAYRDEHDSRPNKRRDRGQDRVTRERDSFGRNAHGDQAKSIKYAQNERHSRDDNASKRTAAADSAPSQVDAKSAQGVAAAERNQRNTVGQKRSVQSLTFWSVHPTDSNNSDDQELADKLDQEATLEPEEPVDEDAEIERRRKRREEILRKSRASTPALQALQAEAVLASPGSGQASTPQRAEVKTPRSGERNLLSSLPRSTNLLDVASPAEPLSAGQEAVSPAEFDLSNDLNLINSHGEAQAGEEDGPSAADYDPTADMREDERRDELRHGNIGLHGEERQAEQAALATIEEASTEKPDAADDDDFDMFADDIDDSKIAPAKPAAAKAESANADQETVQLAQPNGGGILEGDDKDGYYKIRPGEVLSGQYQVQSALGKGMFSGVARAEDIKSKRLVAIKIMRKNDALRKGGFTEIAILQKLNAADPDDKKHIVRFERAFEYKGHLCMAFENLSMNLREVLKKFGNNVGINLNATRAYAYQIFLSLGHMRKCNIIHADLKPDNILVR